jgi:hypothetical protein
MSTQPEQLARKTNRLAITSLILGILGVFQYGLGFWWRLNWPQNPDLIYLGLIVAAFLFVLLLVGLAGLITGIVAIRRIKTKAEYKKQKTEAIIGIVLGYLNCLPMVLLVILYVLVVLTQQ